MLQIQQRQTHQLLTGYQVTIPNYRSSRTWLNSNSDIPDGTTATGKVDEDGNYTIEIPSNLNLVGGENITASTRDESGNESESTETTVVDATAPDTNSE